MASDTREPRIRSAVPCPQCGAPIGAPCRAGTRPHDPRNGPLDKRQILNRSHAERRAAWQEWKRTRVDDYLSTHH